VFLCRALPSILSTASRLCGILLAKMSGKGADLLSRGGIVASCTRSALRCQKAAGKARSESAVTRDFSFGGVFRALQARKPRFTHHFLTHWVGFPASLLSQDACGLQRETAVLPEGLAAFSRASGQNVTACQSTWPRARAKHLAPLLVAPLLDCDN